MTWEQRMAERAHARADNAKATEQAEWDARQGGWPDFVKARGGWDAWVGWHGDLWHAHWEGHGNCTWDARGDRMGGLWSVALTEDTPPTTGICPICIDYRRGDFDPAWA